MMIFSQAPTLPFCPAGDFSGARGMAGHMCALAFVAVIVVMAANIVTFSPAPGADCLPEICGPSLSS